MAGVAGDEIGDLAGPQDRAVGGRAVTQGPRLVQTPETRVLWEAYAIARQRADDSLLSSDGLVAAQAFYDFVEAFMPQVYGTKVVPLALRRRRA